MRVRQLVAGTHGAGQAAIVGAIFRMPEGLAAANAFGENIQFLT